MNQPTTASESLAPLRQRIDQLDEQIVRLLNERAKIVVEVGKVKHLNDQAPVYAPDREQVVLDRIRQANEGPLSDLCLEAIYRELMSGSFALQRALRIGYLGPAGSFSHLAAKRQFGASVAYHPVESITSVFREVEGQQIDLGLVPIENSIGGGIHETLDSFLTSTARVCAEVLVPIHHHLLTHAEPSQIKRVYSRPEVFEQCRSWLRENLLDADRLAVTSSAKAAEIASEDREAAAIGSDLASEIYNLPVQSANIEDHPGNITRFFVIGLQSPAPSGDDKTAILFTTAHEPGALAAVIDAFRDQKVNLTHIDKRPSQRVNWEYCFFIDCDGHATDPNVKAALAEARKHCLHLTVLGSFPRARSTLA
ncbi:MAG: prephenate dehydratase [Phycisphaeraceae bacterium]